MPWDDIAGIFDDDPDGDELHAEPRRQGGRWLAHRRKL